MNNLRFLRLSRHLQTSIQPEALEVHRWVRRGEKVPQI